MAIVSRLPDHSRPDRLRPDQRRQRRIFFSRRELDQLLQLYSRQVARGEWRDYAIDQSDGSAAFSVFRHSLDAPLYTIVKTAPGSSARRLRAAAPPRPAGQRPGAHRGAGAAATQPRRAQGAGRLAGQPRLISVSQAAL